MSDNKKYYWLKLKEDFFDKKDIRYLRSLPDGDKLIIIYLKLLLSSIRSEGIVYYDGLLDTNVEELALSLDEDKQTIQYTLLALKKIGTIEEREDGSILVKSLKDQNMVGKESKSAERVRRFRDRKKLEALQSNELVTLR